MANEAESLGSTCQVPERDRRNQRRVSAWGLLWSASVAATFVAIPAGWLPLGAPAIAATVFSSVLGLVTFLAYRRSLREADELRRKIEFDAMALAFGVGLVGGATYQLLETSGVVASAPVLNVWVAMTLTYGVAIGLGYRRYR